MSLRSKYARQIRQTFGSGYYASWFPDTPHALGAYGRMEDDVLLVKGNIKDLDIGYDIDEDTVPSALELTSSKGVSITAKLAGATNASLSNIPQASVGLGIEFKGAGSFIIAAGEVYEDRIANPGALEAQLRRLNDKGMWDSSYRIVTGVLRMPVATVIISQASNTKVEMTLEGTGTPAIKELGKAEVRAAIVRESTATMKYMPARNAVPIIQLHKLARGFLFHPPRLRTFAMETVRHPGAEESWQLIIDNDVPPELE